MIDIVTADVSQLQYILQNLRADDLEEIEASGADIALLPRVIMRHSVFAFCACDDVHGPVAAWGMVSRRFGVGAGFAFGTDRWGTALLPMLRQIRGFILPYLFYSDFHRVEAAALAKRSDVRRFMKLIGAEPEGVLECYGANRENFISYRWLADEYCNAVAVPHETAAGSYATH